MIMKLNMKRFLSVLLACALVFGMADAAQAQNKNKKGKGKARTTATAKKGSKATTPTQKAEPEKPALVQLPENSNDCLFAIELKNDVPYGPTTAPDGSGRMQEVVADKAHPHLFEHEHNSVWYKFTVPYNGQLEISIAQQGKWDNYDFLVYKYTGTYFSNQVMLNKVSPVAVNIAQIDSMALYNAFHGKNANKAEKAATTASKPAAKKSGKVDADAPPTFEETPGLKPTIGMFVDATDRMLTRQQTGKFIKSIPVRSGEVYYIVLDNNTLNGMGHTIKVSVQVDAYEPLVLFYDKKGRRYVDVDLMILERSGNGQDRTLLKNEHYRGGRIKFVPGYDYTLYAKREGYFSVFKEFNARSLMLKGDTTLMCHMERIERGTMWQLKEVYFDDGASALIGNPDSVLRDYQYIFLNHPDVNFLVKCYVQSYGVDAEADMLLTLNRAKAVKEWFVKNGISADRISTAGMTKNEIKRAAAAALDEKGKGFSTVSCELIVTGRSERR